MDLSILIPARNEMFLARTIENILETIEGDTEVIAVCDGNWPDPPIEDHPRVSLIHHSEAIGQRAATNEAARLSQAKFIMKADAHCAFDKGFDVKLMANCEPDWTVVPRMLNLHAFNWKCEKCGKETYQGPKPSSCKKCSNTSEFEMVVIWKRREGRKSDYMWFNTDLRFSYFDKTHLKDYGDDASALKRQYGHMYRDWAKGDITDQMCAIGACWMMHRERYWDLEGVDEAHGSWGQMGVEIAMKSWLSGGRQVVNKKTWFAHMFRTQGSAFGFPYPLRGRDVQKARKYSQKLWKGNLWPKAKYPLSWLINKFAPLPGWNGDSLIIVDEAENVTDDMIEAIEGCELKPIAPWNDHLKLTKGLVYYTDNKCKERILEVCKKQIKKCCPEWPIVSVSLLPVDFGENFVMDLSRSVPTMFKQILKGIEECPADIIFLTEHDVLYHPSHFDFTPPEKDVFYYNENVWKVDAKTGQALFYYTKRTSCLCAYRELLLEHYQKRVERVEREGRFSRSMGFEPGTHSLPRGVDNYKAESYKSEYPNIDIRHSSNLTANRFKKEQFRSEKSYRGWTEADELPGWGRTKGRFDELLQEIEK